MLVIEHHLDVVKCADWIIDLGPEGGAGGGRVLATGTPEEVAALPDNSTGQFLRPLLAAFRHDQAGQAAAASLETEANSQQDPAAGMQEPSEGAVN